MTADEPARGGRPGPSSAPGAAPSALVAALAALEHPGARRRFRVAAPGDAAPTFSAIADLRTPAAVAERRAADPVAALGIEELTGSMAFHALAAPLVDLAVGLLVVDGSMLDGDPGCLLARTEGTAVVEVAVPAGVVLLPAGPDGADRVAAWLVDALDPIVALIAPIDAPLRWGAVADLVTVLALGRSRVHGLPAERAWALAVATVAGLRSRRPHPVAVPTRLAVPGPGGAVLALAHRCSCCQWHRAARHLGESVADARCADCPSLDGAVAVDRLAALAADGRLAVP